MMLSFTCSLFLCSTIALAVIICEYNITITIFDVDTSEIEDISCDERFVDKNVECDTEIMLWDGNGKCQRRSDKLFDAAVHGEVKTKWKNSIIFRGNIDLSPILTIKITDQDHNADLVLCSININQSNIGLPNTPRSCVPTLFTGERKLRLKTTIHLIKQRCNFSTTTGATTTGTITTMGSLSTQTSQNSTNLVNTSFSSTHHSTTHRFQLQMALSIVGGVLIAMAVAFIAGIAYFRHKRLGMGRQVHNMEQDSVAFADTQLVSRSELSTKRNASVSLFSERTLPQRNMSRNTTFPCKTTAAVSSDGLNLNTLPTTGRIAYPSLISTRTASGLSFAASSRTMPKSVPKLSVSNSLFNARRGRESDLIVKPTTSFDATQIGYNSKTTRSSVSASSKASRRRDRYVIDKTRTSNVRSKPIQLTAAQRYHAKPFKEKPTDNV